MTRSFKVEYIHRTDTPNVDITDYVITLDKMHLQSGGRISTAALTLNAEHGRFTSVNSADAPLLKKFDLLKITIIDDLNVERQSKTYEIVTDTSQFDVTAGYILPIELEGLERNLSGIPFSGLFRHASHDEMLDNILSAYIAQRASDQPRIFISRNDLTDINPAIWDFTFVDNCYDAINHVIDQSGLPVSAGGLGDRYAIYYEDSKTVKNAMSINIVSQGARAGGATVLMSGTFYPFMSIHRTKQASTGTMAVIRGNPKSGTLPSNFATFRDKLEFWRAIRQYDSTATYPVGAHIRHNNKTYRAIVAVTPNNAPPNASWQEIDVGDYIGTMDYSPWTKNKRKEILNGLSAPEGGFDSESHSSTSIMDCNAVIHDTNVNREVVILRTNTSELTDAFKQKYQTMFGNTNQWLHGTTVLVDRSLGPVQGDFLGTDVNGRRYENNIARYVVNGTNKQWIVTRETQEFDLVAVYSEGRTYEWNTQFQKSTVTSPNKNVRGGPNRKSAVFTKQSKARGGNPSGTFAWRDITQEFLGNDCFHHPISVSQVDGLMPTFESLTKTHLDDPSGTPYKKNSAIEIQFGYTGEDHTPMERDFWSQLAEGIKTIVEIVNAIPDALIRAFFTPRYSTLGWWFCFPAPFPFSRHNDITSEIGSIFGGQNGTTLNQHRFWDMYNIARTPSGKIGFAHPDSKDLSEITGFSFLLKYDVLAGGNRIPWTGDIPFSVWCLDVHGVTWKSEKIIYRHLGDVQRMEVDFADFRPIYRARTSFGFSNILDQITLPELEVNEAMFKDDILFMGIQCEASYDDQGRYSPDWWEHIIKPTFFDFFNFTSGDVRFVGTIDALTFVKAPLAISKSDSVNSKRRIVTAIQDYPNIINTEQLQRIADSQAEIEQWQYEQYTIRQQGIANLDLEDSVFLTSEMVPDAERISASRAVPNTVRLAVREIKYSSTHEGAMIRELTLVRKIR